MNVSIQHNVAQALLAVKYEMNIMTDGPADLFKANLLLTSYYTNNIKLN